MLWCVLAAALGTDSCGPAEITDPAAVWDPCHLPTDPLAEAGFPAGRSGGCCRRAEPGRAGCGWSSGGAVVRVLFTIAGSPETVGGAEATRTTITVANRTGQGVQPRADSAADCTAVLPTESGGLIQVRLDSAGAETGAEVCGRTERVTSVLAPALPA